MKTSFSLKHLVIISSLFSSQLANANVIGQVQVAKGDVTVQDLKGVTKPAKFGMRIETGDVIVTGKDARAKIVMLDKNIINISPESKMVFDKYDQKIEETKETVLGVVYGKIRTEVKAKYDDDKTKFRVHTKAAVAGVRGTDWVTSYTPPSGNPSTGRAPNDESGGGGGNNGYAEFTTVSGNVTVGLLGPDGELTNTVDVLAGQSSSLSLGDIPPPPTDVPAENLQSMQTETKVEGGSDSFDPSVPDPEGNSSGESGGSSTGGGTGNAADGGETKEGSGDPSQASSEGGTGSASNDQGSEKTSTYDSGFDSGFESGDVALDSAVQEIEAPKVDLGFELPILELPKVPDTADICQFCNETVQGGTTNLIININLE
mgnify:CR=1 FL=1